VLGPPSKGRPSWGGDWERSMAFYYIRVSKRTVGFRIYPLPR
jgi:hypothetical protein